jgi:hypothetical protein
LCSVTAFIIQSRKADPKTKGSDESKDDDNNQNALIDNWHVRMFSLIWLFLLTFVCCRNKKKILNQADELISRSTCVCVIVVVVSHKMAQNEHKVISITPASVKIKQWNVGSSQDLSAYVSDLYLTAAKSQYSGNGSKGAHVCIQDVYVPSDLKEVYNYQFMEAEIMDRFNQIAKFYHRIFVITINNHFGDPSTFPQLPSNQDNCSVTLWSEDVRIIRPGDSEWKAVVQMRQMLSVPDTRTEEERTADEERRAQRVRVLEEAHQHEAPIRQREREEDILEAQMRAKEESKSN